MGPPVGRARSPPGLAPIIVGAGGYSPPRETRNPPPGTFGRPVSALLAIFHIREPCALNTISNIIGFAVAAGHRLLTRTREQEPMGRPRRTRTREPPGGAQSSPAPGDHGRAPPDAKRASWRMGGWRGRAHTHPGGSPRPGASRRSLKLIARPAHPLPPEEGLSSGVCLRQPGLLSRRTPGPSPSSPGGRAGACYGLFPPSPATIVLRPLGRRLIKQSGALPYTES